MVTPAGETYTYHYNGIGSTIAVTDQAKNVVNKYSYTAFGVLTDYVEAVSQPFKYAGQYGVMYEPGGLYYMRARYYDADTGRFISEDPSGFNGGINLYAYCNSNPVNFVDPLGLCAEGGGVGSAILDVIFGTGTAWAGEETKKQTGWWPNELDLLVPGYGNYGGPIRNGPASPIDLLDAAYERHDIGYMAGDLNGADERLLADLRQLPINPGEWGGQNAGFIHAVYGAIHRGGSYTLFSIRLNLTGDRDR